MTQSQTPTSDLVIVSTARWVVLMLLLIAVLGATALLMSLRVFKYADNTRKALTENIQTIRGSYDPVLTSLQQQLRETQARDRYLEGEFAFLTERLQFAEDELELDYRQTRQGARKSKSNSTQLHRERAKSSGSPATPNCDEP